MLIKKIHDSISILNRNNGLNYESSPNMPYANANPNNAAQALTEIDGNTYEITATNNGNHYARFYFNFTNINTSPVGYFFIARKMVISTPLQTGSTVSYENNFDSGYVYFHETRETPIEDSATYYKAWIDAIAQDQYSYPSIDALYLACSYAAYPVASLSIGSRSKVTLSANFDNSEGYAAYNAAMKVRVFSPDQYNAAGFNPATSACTYEDNYSKQNSSLSNTVSQSKTLTLVAEPSAALIAGQSYRAYYFIECARVSNNASLYQSGWLYTAFIPAASLNPPAPVISQTTTNVQQTININISVADIPTGQLMDYVLVEYSRDDGLTWNTLGKVYVDASGNGSIKDIGYNPTIISKYRAATCTRDNADALIEYRSLFSNIIATEKSNRSFIICDTALINDALFSEFERGKFVDDNVEQWCIGAQSPNVSFGTKKLESGSFSIYCRSAEEIAAADAIILSNSPVCFIADDGIYHHAYLKNTTNEYLQTIEKRSMFKAEWQDVE